GEVQTYRGVVVAQVSATSVGDPWWYCGDGHTDGHTQRGEMSELPRWPCQRQSARRRASGGNVMPDEPSKPQKRDPKKAGAEGSARGGPGKDASSHGDPNSPRNARTAAPRAPRAA